MKNKFKKAIITTVSVLSISLLALPELAVPSPCPPEPFETDSGEEPGDGNGCEPLSDRQYLQVLQFLHFDSISSRYLQSAYHAAF